jgi:hypothetical protein
VTSSIFHEPWWLDAVALGGWKEARVEENGQWVARLPYVERRFLGVRLQLAPPLAARLGPIADVGPGRMERRLRRFSGLVDDLLDQLPPADLFRQVLHPETLSWLPFHRRGFRVEPQVSYVIDDLPDLDRVWSGLSSDTRRVVGKAGRELHVVRDATAHDLSRMVQATGIRQNTSSLAPPEVLDRAVREAVARARGVVLTAQDAGGAVHASLFCVWDEGRAWYIAGGGDSRLRRHGGGPLLMWEMIREAARHVDRLDFEGSMLPGVEHYFRSFGGRQETCYLVTRASRRIAPFWALYQRRRDRLQRRATARGPDPTGGSR